MVSDKYAPLLSQDFEHQKDSLLRSDLENLDSSARAVARTGDDEDNQDFDFLLADSDENSMAFDVDLLDEEIFFQVSYLIRYFELTLENKAALSFKDSTIILEASQAIGFNSSALMVGRLWEQLVSIASYLDYQSEKLFRHQSKNHHLDGLTHESPFYSQWIKSLRSISSIDFLDSEGLGFGHISHFQRVINNLYESIGITPSLSEENQTVTIAQTNRKKDKEKRLTLKIKKTPAESSREQVEGSTLSEESSTLTQPSSSEIKSGGSSSLKLKLFSSKRPSSSSSPNAQLSHPEPVENPTISLKVINAQKSEPTLDSNNRYNAGPSESSSALPSYDIEEDLEPLGTAQIKPSGNTKAPKFSLLSGGKAPQIKLKSMFEGTSSLSDKKSGSKISNQTKSRFQLEGHGLNEGVSPTPIQIDEPEDEDDRPYRTRGKRLSTSLLSSAMEGDSDETEGEQFDTTFQDAYQEEEDGVEAEESDEYSQEEDSASDDEDAKRWKKKRVLHLGHSDRDSHKKARPAAPFYVDHVGQPLQRLEGIPGINGSSSSRSSQFSSGISKARLGPKADGRDLIRKKLGLSKR